MIGSESRPIRKWFEARARAPRVKAQKRSARNPHVQVVEQIQFLDMFVPLCASPFSYCCSCPLVLFVSAVLHLSWEKADCLKEVDGIDKRWFHVSGCAPALVLDGYVCPGTGIQDGSYTDARGKEQLETEDKMKTTLQSKNQEKKRR